MTVAASLPVGMVLVPAGQVYHNGMGRTEHLWAQSDPEVFQDDPVLCNNEFPVSDLCISALSLKELSIHFWCMLFRSKLWLANCLAQSRDIFFFPPV